MNKTERELKVYGHKNSWYEEPPTIMMKGKWLQEYGFEVGQKYHVQCEQGRLILTLMK